MYPSRSSCRLGSGTSAGQHGEVLAHSLDHRRIIPYDPAGRRSVTPWQHAKQRRRTQPTSGPTTRPASTRPSRPNRSRAGTPSSVAQIRGNRRRRHLPVGVVLADADASYVLQPGRDQWAERSDRVRRLHAARVARRPGPRPSRRDGRPRPLVGPRGSCSVWSSDSPWSSVGCGCGCAGRTTSGTCSAWTTWVSPPASRCSSSRTVVFIVFVVIGRADRARRRAPVSAPQSGVVAPVRRGRNRRRRVAHQCVPRQRRRGRRVQGLGERLVRRRRQGHRGRHRATGLPERVGQSRLTRRVGHARAAGSHLRGHRDADRHDQRVPGVDRQRRRGRRADPRLRRDQERRRRAGPSRSRRRRTRTDRSVRP